MPADADCGTLWQVRLRASRRIVDALAAAFAADALALSVFDSGNGASWVLDTLVADRERARALVRAMAAHGRAAGWPPVEGFARPLEDRDWLAESYASLPPLRIDRFFVHGAHDRARRPNHRWTLEIDASTAFGSGHHETTAGCLSALAALARRRRGARVLDMGCGSGLLALAAVRLWPAQGPARVLAVDNDPAAIALSRRHARRNRLAPRVRLVLADDPRHRTIRRAGRFDVIVANILAGPLRAMAGDLRRRLAPGGHLVLSGILVPQQAGVLAAYRAHGLSLRTRIRRGPWATLVLTGRRPPWHSAGPFATQPRTHS